ncbi:hypothetical protein F8388_005820 [Cannabis sativa]|uniref:DUF4283 domain-containing protein n=1 Tax=Cannabis sativa TaxID=3483 RepID=A0A7J6HFW5_CANSA|nr:hypothetical protein F8388_005820 [Cannabis sativa]KAF4404576.1 hypothetical protein G4B88_005962 [Cannabis sativa]
MSMDEVGDSTSGINGRCLSLKKVSISPAPSVVTTNILSKLCIFGKIISSKTFTAKDVEHGCSILWKTRFRVEPIDNVLAGSNTFRFIFENGAVYRKILEQGPWCVKGDMLALLSWSSGFGAKDPSFNSIRFWIQIHLLPHDYYSRTNANMLGALAGKVVTIELEESKPVTWKSWIRVLVEVDVNRPLCCDYFFKTMAHPQSKYESCFSVNPAGVAVENMVEKGKREFVVGGDLFGGEMVVGRDNGGGAMVVCQEVSPAPVLEKGASAPPRGAGPLTRAEASRSMHGWALRSRGGGLVRTAWRPKAAGEETEAVPHLGELSLSPVLNHGKLPDLLPSSEMRLNCVENDELGFASGRMCRDNRVNRLNPFGDHVACENGGSDYLKNLNMLCGPPELARDWPLGSNNGLEYNYKLNSKA